MSPTDDSKTTQDEDPEKGSDTEEGTQESEKQDATTQDDFDSWMAALPDDQRKTVKTLFDAKVQKLQNTVRDTRDERDRFQKQLREAAKGAAKGSEQQEQLTKLADDLQRANVRADFYEEAPVQGCRNPKAAYLIAVSGELFRKGGEPDWTAIKAAAPELFEKPNPRNNAGSGTSAGVHKGQSVNDWIREQAGKK